MGRRGQSKTQARHGPPREDRLRDRTQERLLSPKPPAPPASSPAVRAIMQGNRGRDTRPEVALRSELHRRGLRFRKHVRPLVGSRVTADAVFPTECVAVFVDGCFWHGCPDHGRVPKTNSAYWADKISRNLARASRTDAALHDAGWIVVRAWEHEPPPAIADRVADAVVGRRRQDGANGRRQPPTPGNLR
ncbi:MAG: very short patch repair endonuclease [Solirubrobacterales bacterium]